MIFFSDIAVGQRYYPLTISNRWFYDSFASPIRVVADSLFANGYRYFVLDKPDFALLWKEECDILHTLGQQVPSGGTIVEIGTALGGSGVIFADATKGKNVKIYSVDISPSPRAYQNLSHSVVEIVPHMSSTFAEHWGKDIKKPIDLLFIDGNHSFQGVYEDFNNWASHLRPGGSMCL